MKYIPYLFLMCVLAWYVPAVGQDIVVPAGDVVAAASVAPPQSPAPLPDTKVGWLDLLIKKLPGLLGAVFPVLLVLLKVKGKTVFAKIPKEWAPLVSALLAALASLADASVGGAVLDGGGVAPDTAAVTGAGTALVVHPLANKVVAALEAEQDKS